MIIFSCITDTSHFNIAMLMKTQLNNVLLSHFSQLSTIFFTTVTPDSGSTILLTTMTNIGSQTLFNPVFCTADTKFCSVLKAVYLYKHNNKYFENEYKRNNECSLTQSECVVFARESIRDVP